MKDNKHHTKGKSSPSLQFAKKKVHPIKSKNSTPLIRTSIGESKVDLIKHVQAALSAGAKLGKDIIVGVNSVSGLIESQGKPSVIGLTQSRNSKQVKKMVICLAKDTSPQTMHTYIMEACKIRQLPIVVVPRLKTELATTLKLKSASCFAVVLYDEIESREGSNIDSLLKTSKLDALHDYLLELHEINVTDD